MKKYIKTSEELQPSDLTAYAFCKKFKAYCETLITKVKSQNETPQEQSYTHSYGSGGTRFIAKSHANLNMMLFELVRGGRYEQDRSFLGIKVGSGWDYSVESQIRTKLKDKFKQLGGSGVQAGGRSQFSFLKVVTSDGYTITYSQSEGSAWSAYGICDITSPEGEEVYFPSLKS